MSINNLTELRKRMVTDPEFINKLKANPIETLKNELNPREDPKIFKLVLYFVGFALIFSLIIAAVITLSGPIELTNTQGETYQEARSVDQFFVMIGSAAIGALAGLLVPRPEQS